MKAGGFTAQNDLVLTCDVEMSLGASTCARQKSARDVVHELFNYLYFPFRYLGTIKPQSYVPSYQLFHPLG
jgi:hypothetical protein